MATNLWAILTLSAPSMTAREAGYTALMRLYRKESAAPPAGSSQLHVLAESSSSAAAGNTFTYNVVLRMRYADQIQYLLRAVVALRTGTPPIPDVRIYMHYIPDDDGSGKGADAQEVLVYHGNIPSVQLDEALLTQALAGRLGVGVPISREEGLENRADLTFYPALNKPRVDYYAEEDEAMLQQNYKTAFQEAFGHKPWTAEDDTYFSLRCMCRIHDADMVAEPCEHLCLCLRCYDDVEARSSVFLERCPRCAARVTSVHRL